MCREGQHFEPVIPIAIYSAVTFNVEQPHGRGELMDDFTKVLPLHCLAISCSLYSVKCTCHVQLSPVVPM